MHYLLTILLSFYPTLFIYQAIPEQWMKGIDGIIPNGPGFFFVHLAVFLGIFFVTYSVLKKFISLGYGSHLKRGLFALIALSVLVAAFSLITFYNVLPGEVIYSSPQFVDDYLLKNPYTFIAFALPFIYLFFD